MRRSWDLQAARVIVLALTKSLHLSMCPESWLIQNTVPRAEVPRSSYRKTYTVDHSGNMTTTMETLEATPVCRSCRRKKEVQMSTNSEDSRYMSEVDVVGLVCRTTQDLEFDDSEAILPTLNECHLSTSSLSLYNQIPSILHRRFSSFLQAPGTAPAP